MPAATEGSKYILGMGDDFSGWAEYKALRKASSRVVAKFIYEVWMACFGCPLLIVNDGGPENQALTKELLERFNVRNVQVAAYHPQLKGLVKLRASEHRRRTSETHATIGEARKLARASRPSLLGRSDHCPQVYGKDAIPSGLWARVFASGGDRDGELACGGLVARGESGE